MIRVAMKIYWTKKYKHINTGKSNLLLIELGTGSLILMYKKMYLAFFVLAFEMPSIYVYELFGV